MDMPASVTPLYDVVLTDPPWSYTGQQAKWAAAAKHYPTMTDSELAAFTLPVQPIDWT